MIPADGLRNLVAQRWKADTTDEHIEEDEHGHEHDDAEGVLELTKLAQKNLGLKTEPANEATIFAC